MVQVSVFFKVVRDNSNLQLVWKLQNLLVFPRAAGGYYIEIWACENTAHGQKNQIRRLLEILQHYKIKICIFEGCWLLKISNIARSVN